MKARLILIAAIVLGLAGMGRAEPPIIIEPVAAVSGRACWLGSCDGVDAWVALRATTRVSVAPPVPIAMTYAAKGTRYQEPHTVVMVDADGKPSAGALEFAPGETRQVRLHIAGLTQAGDHQMSLRWTVTPQGTSPAPPESAPVPTAVDTSLHVALREPAGVAAVCILLGVLGAELIRYIRRRAVPRLVAQRALLLAAQQGLGEAGTDQAWSQPIVDLLRARVVQAIEFINQGFPANERIADQINLFRRWRELQTIVRTLPDEERTAFQEKLDVARGALLANPDPIQLDVAKGALDIIDDDVYERATKSDPVRRAAFAPIRRKADARASFLGSLTAASWRQRGYEALVLLVSASLVTLSGVLALWEVDRKSVV